MNEANYIKLRPDRTGWTLLVYTDEAVHEYGLGDVLQFVEEVDRTVGLWVADGPADFHAIEVPERPTEEEFGDLPILDPQLLEEDE